jgi:hypothetical protein
MAKIAWHTDIVVNGQGMNVKIATPRAGACAKLTIKPDVPGRKSAAAKKRFEKAVETARPSACSAASLRAAVTGAVLKTKARWNQWHHETYS